MESIHLGVFLIDLGDQTALTRSETLHWHRLCLQTDLDPPPFLRCWLWGSCHISPIQRTKRGDAFSSDISRFAIQDDFCPKSSLCQYLRPSSWLSHAGTHHPQTSPWLCPPQLCSPMDTRMLAATTITTYPPWREPMKQSTAGQQSAVFSKQNHE